MSSRTLTGLLLIIGPIAMIVGFSGWIVVLGDTDFSDTKAIIPALGDHVGGIKPFALVGTVGLLLALAGIGGVKNSMDGGPGHSIAGLGFLLMVIGMVGAVAETGLTLGTGEASSTAAKAAAAAAAAAGTDGAAGLAGDAATASAVATSLWAASQAVGAALSAVAFLGFGIVGCGILIQKNFHTVIGALMIVGGIIGAIVACADYQSPLMFIPYVAYPVLTLAMGVITVRSKS